MAEPRPVVKQITLQPPAASPVIETGSYPGVSITTSPSRWDQREKVIESNKLIQLIVEKSPQVTFLPFREQLLDEKGEPRKALFRDDQLHLNAEGYRLLAAALRPLIAQNH